MDRKPLNGTKSHPLTAHALAELRDIASKPCPRQAVNPGVSDRLLREDLVEVVMLPSPFKTHGGKLLAHLEITDAGRRVAGLAPNAEVQGRGAGFPAERPSATTGSAAAGPDKGD